MSIRLEHAGRSVSGTRYEPNFDAMSVGEVRGLYLIADTIPASGPDTPEITVSALVDSLEAPGGAVDPDEHLALEPSDDSGADSRLRKAIETANDRVYETLDHGRSPIKTANVVALAFAENEVRLGWIGNNRIYRFRDGRLRQRTEDHSLMNMLDEEAPAPGQDWGGTLPTPDATTRNLGQDEDVEADLQRDTPRLHDVYLLCSNGFHAAIEGEEIEARLRNGSEDLSETCAGLLASANANNDGPDMTLILVKVVGT